MLIASVQDDEPVSIAPFEAITFSLEELWDLPKRAKVLPTLPRGSEGALQIGGQFCAPIDTRDFSFGVAVYDHVLPDELQATLQWWIEEVSADNFAENVSSKGVMAWAVRHEASVQHQDVLVERLRRIISELASL